LRGGRARAGLPAHLEGVSAANGRFAGEEILAPLNLHSKERLETAMGKLLNAGDPLDEDFSKGPEIGEKVPEFTLPDQCGNAVRYRPDGKRKALILFHRSASW